jgi:hypothetical protein
MYPTDNAMYPIEENRPLRVHDQTATTSAPSKMAVEADQPSPVAILHPARPRLITRAMSKPLAWPLRFLLVGALGACSTAKPHPASQLEWHKSSDFAPSLEVARQHCKVQAAAETLGMPGGTAVVGGDFVKCMRAAGWTLLDHGAE